MFSERRAYSFHKGFNSDNALNFSKRSSLDYEIMLERVYPSRLIIPMLQHYGKECIPIVKPGQQVTIGQCVGVPEQGTMGVPVHSGISGTVDKIKPIVLPDERICRAVFIEGDRKRTFHPSVRPRNNVNISASSVMGIVRDAGIVGMGGEGVPTIAKINRARRLKVKELLVNCLQSEPFAQSDYLLINEYADYIIMGAVAAAGACGVHVINILISKDRKKEIMALRSAMERSFSMYSGFAFNFVHLKPRYPQGYYRLVARALYDVELEEGDSIEKRCGAVMFNCATVYACWNAIAESMPLVSRVISINNEDGLDHNVIAPVGTPVSELLDTVKGLDNTSKNIIWGNCFTGLPVKDPDMTPVIKTTTGISLVRERPDQVLPCSGCGRCADVCPYDLHPNILRSLIKAGKYDTADDFNAARCIACGACSYICPANIDLSETVGAYASAKRKRGIFPYNGAGDRDLLDDPSLLTVNAVRADEVKQPESDSLKLPFEGWDGQ